MVGMGQVVGMQKVPVVQMVGFVISQTSVKESSVSSRNQEYHWLESKLPGHFSLSFPLWKTSYLHASLCLLASDLQKHSAWQ